MRALGKTLVVVSLGCGLCAAAAACLDLTPIVYETAPRPDVYVPPEPEGGVDASPGDAQVVLDGDAAVAMDVDDRPPCIRCITGADDAAVPGCADEIATCMVNAECADTYACALANHCFEQPSFRDIVNCGLPCAEEAGIYTSSDPAVTLIYDLAKCAQVKCGGPCNIGDASIPD